ncbi:MAG: dUTP diphosphatase [Patescibacteria group bacterium]
MSLVLKVKKLDPRAKLPRYALPGDAGLDFFCYESVVIPPGMRHIFHTGIAVEIPQGHVGLVWDRGGNSNKRGLKTLGGVFDSGYRGEVIICLLNTTQEPITIAAESAIAQMLIQKIEEVTVVEEKELSESHRGERRFGSTGV